MIRVSSERDLPHAMQARPDPSYVRQLLELAQLSQRAAARRLGIDERTMRYYCSGKREMPYAAQYCLEVLAAAVLTTNTDWRPLPMPATWSSPATRPLTAADVGRLVVGPLANGSGWCVGRIVSKESGIVIELLPVGMLGGVWRPVSVDTLEAYAVLESPGA